MDILKDVKTFFYYGGLDSLIHKFRNPTDEESIVFNANYISQTDVVEWSDPDSEDTGRESKKINHFDKRLKKELTALLTELENGFANLQSIAENDPKFVAKVFLNSEIDFVRLRSDISANVSWDRYQDLLCLFVSQIEVLYSRSKKTLLNGKGNTNNKSKQHRKPEAISFGFIGNNEQLKKVYYELHLDSGSFIDETKTTFSQFQAILTSKDVSREHGEIWFGCETKQVCYIIRLISRLFTKLNFKLLGDSGKFITKNGAILTGNIISRNKSNDPKQKTQIDSAIRSLLKM